MKNIMLLLGRVALVSFIVIPATLQTMNLSQSQMEFAQTGVPYSNFVLVAALALQFLGSLLVLLGFKTRMGVFVLLAYLVPVSVYFTLPTGLANAYPFLQNLSSMGGLFILAASGPGALSIDRS